jgi:hypothetical protein
MKWQKVIQQDNVVLSGVERVQSAIVIVRPLIGPARYSQAWLLAILRKAFSGEL